MLTRLAIAAAVFAGAALFAALCAACQKRRIAAAAGQSQLTKPTILYFWSEMCTPCKMVQSPALDRLQAELGPDCVEIVRIDALRDPDAASQWGVMTTPTTIVLGTDGQPRQINNRAVPLPELREQLASMQEKCA